MPVPSYYKSFICMEYLNQLIWVPNADAYDSFLKKEQLCKETSILRNLERLVTIENDKTSIAYIKDKLIENNKKIISVNRKIEREGWSYISDQYMKQMMES